MADKRISQLNPHTSPSGSDLLVIVNNNETKKITYADLKDSIVINSDNGLLNQFSASYLIDSTSFDERIIAATNEQDLTPYVTEIVYGVLSGSVDSRFDNLELHTGSYLTSLPSGLISQSTDLSSLNTFTQSIDNRVDSLESWSSSLDSTFATDLQVSIVSSSVAATIGVISQQTGLVTTSSFNDFSSSVHTEILAATNEQDLSNLEVSASLIQSWNKNKEYMVGKSDQLTFSGDYVLDNAYLFVEGGQSNTIGDWIFETWDTNGTYTPSGSNGYIITGPTGDTNASIGIWMHRQFDIETIVSIDYVWNGTDVGNDWPIYMVDNQYPYEIDTQNRLQDINASSESGTWVISVPAGSWLSIGVNTANVNNTAGTLQITLPYLFNPDMVEYSPNKYFKKEGKIFIGGNLLLKNGEIENNGFISVGGEVILIGNSQIYGTGTII